MTVRVYDLPYIMVFYGTNSMVGILTIDPHQRGIVLTDITITWIILISTSFYQEIPTSPSLQLRLSIVHTIKHHRINYDFNETLY